MLLRCIIRSRCGLYTRSTMIIRYPSYEVQGTSHPDRPAIRGSGAPLQKTFPDADYLGCII